MSRRLARLLRWWADRLDPVPQGFRGPGRMTYEPGLYAGRWLTEREAREICQR